MSKPDCLKILFFARLRDELDTREELLTLPENVSTVEQLRSHLCQRGDQWQKSLNTDGLFVAVEQKVVDWNSPLSGNEEVAFFPPVTGG
ncbi:MAG: molybdopterin converting factor subunit 1 [Cellvibrionaceae bacterium]